MEREVLLTGRDNAPPAWLALRAGPVSLFLDGADVRHVRVAGLALVDQIYMALRDDAWNTLPLRLHDVVVQQEADSFRVSFKANHRHADIDFNWNGTILGFPDGRLSYEMDGIAASSFRYNRIGLNVLHRTDLVIGRRYRSGGAIDPPSAEFTGIFDAAIQPQAIVNGQLAGMSPPFRWLEIDLTDHAAVRLDFEGDDFEPEDQRNFGDSTFKTYSTPVSRPGPFHAVAGTGIHQSVGVTVSGSAPAAEPPDAPIVLTVATGVAEDGATRLPALGLGCASDGLPLTLRERERIALLHPAHLRLALTAGASDGPARLAVAAADALALGCRLDVELSLDADTDAGLAWAAAALAAHAHLLGTLLVRAPSDEPFDAGPPGRVLETARERLGAALPGVQVGAASTFLAALHRSPASAEQIGAAGFSVSPAVHRADDATIMENILGLRTEVVEARAHVAGGPVKVGPVTLATISGPYPDGPPDAGDPPPQVDVRQPSLLAAAWTVGALAELAAAAPTSITWYETAGWRGVMERAAGSSMPHRFRSIPGAVFPLWHVLADAAEWRHAQLCALAVSRRRDVAAIAARDATGVHLLVANLTRQNVAVELRGLTAGPGHLRRLSAASAQAAMTRPDAWRAGADPAITDAHGVLALTLDAYEVVRLDPAG